MADLDPRWQQLRAAFSVELDERVRDFNQLLLRLEQGEPGQADPEIFDALFREAHNLKGAARAVELPTLERLVHALESVLDAARAAGRAPEAAWFDLVYRAVDLLSPLYTAALEGDDTPPSGYETALAELAHLSQPPAAEPDATSGNADSKASARRPASSGGGRTRGRRGAAGSPGGSAVARLAPLAVDDGATPSLPPAPDKADRGLDAAPPVPPPSTVTPLAAAETTSGGSAESGVRVASDSVRVAVGKLDALLTQAGELAVTHIRIEQRLHELRELRQEMYLWQREQRGARGLRTALRRIITGHAETPGATARELEALLRFSERAEQRTRTLLQDIDSIATRFRQDTAQLALVAGEIEGEVLAVRLLPVASVVGPFERLVRDLTRQQGKEARFIVEGGNTEIDRKILDQLRDPLMHMLRNAVDHGLERPEERLAHGKPRMGTIRLSAVQRGGAIEIELQDDGRGLDLERVRAVAMDRGLITSEQAQVLDDRESHELIFVPGFSTSATVTETSGRGVGMDVVRDNVERLNGEIRIESVPGRGTQFVLSVPLTLATTRAILVEQGGQLFAIPSATVERNARVRESQLARLEGRRAVEIEGRPVPVAELGDILERPRTASMGTDDWRAYLVLRQGDRRIAVLTDRLVGEQEIVVKSLGWPLRRVRNVGGAAVLGSGQTVLILNPADLLKSGFKMLGTSAAVIPRQALPAAGPGHRHRLLVVDDSLTTRTLERTILEAAGYDVVVAADGVEALTALRNEPIELVVSDVDMPRLDGFGLTAEIRRDERLRQLPVVLITSLDAQEHRERGVAVGADAYIIKSSFDQGQLLDTVSRLL